MDITPPRRAARSRFLPKLDVGTVVWVLLLSFLGYRMWPQVAAAFGVASASAQAPSLRVATLDGDSLSLDALRGKVVLVNFWATWCPPCRIEMPGFQRVYDEKKNAGFTIVGLSTDATGSAAVRAFLAERGVTYPVAMANGQAVRDFGGVSLLPSSFLIDRQGRIRHEVRGMFTSLALEQAVDRLLAEPASPSAATDAASGR